jgi:hypothetical protein
MSMIGRVETLWDTCISGWAADDTDPGRRVLVDVIVNSRQVASIPCATFRPDLRAAGIGDGCKAFSFDPSPYLKPGRNNLEVRYAGSDAVVPKGRGCWIRRRAGRITDGEAGFLAALEAYHEFKPEQRICAIGEGAGRLRQVLVEAGIPFRKVTVFEAPPDPAAILLAEKADVLVSLACDERTPNFIRGLLNRPGFLAVGFREDAEVSHQISGALAESGASKVKLESIGPAHGGRRSIFAFAQVGGVETPEEGATPLLAHIHVPKCAGTSFRALLERYFGPRHLRLYVNDTYFVYGDEALRSYLLQDPEIQGYSSHHVRVFPRWLAGREMLYITFLRDPIQQFVSYMTHIKKHYSTITSPSLLEAVPPDAPQLTLREFAKWLLTQERDIPFRENHNVNFFARHSHPAAVDRLAAAKAVLDEFFFVGITERMEESIDKLRALARAACLEFPPGPMPLENTSADYRDDLRWIDPDDEVGSLLLGSVEQDRQLYEWATEHLAALHSHC